MLGQLFKEARSSIITFDGKTVRLHDRIVVPEHCQLIITFLKADSDWRQGIWIGQRSLEKSQLQLTCNGLTAKSLELWIDTAPPVVQIDMVSPSGSIDIYNKWQKPGGPVLSQILGAGMLVDVDSHGLRHYRCNDGHTEPTFQHLRFAVEIQPAS